MGLRHRIEKLETYKRQESAKREVDCLLKFCTDDELDELISLVDKIKALEKETGITQLELLTEDKEGKEIDRQIGQIWDRARQRMRASDGSEAEL